MRSRLAGLRTEGKGSLAKVARALRARPRAYRSTIANHASSPRLSTFSSFDHFHLPFPLASQTIAAMQRLIEGVHKFRTEEFGRYKQLFKRLSRDGQKPHTLFITCSDSRVLAELITQSKPGDLFVVKNVGNIVPPTTVVGETNSTAAAVEFAVDVLQVSDIVVCGHSQCGAMQALLNEVPKGENFTHLQQWLEVAAPVRNVIERQYTHLTDPELRATAAAEENVLFAVENLTTYPAVQRRLASGELRLHAWFFKLDSAELFAYDPEAKQFAPLPPP